MALTTLTPAQSAAVGKLLAARRIETVVADPQRASAFLAAAAERIAQLPLLTSDSVRYDIAYDAMHDTGEALLAAYGYRTTNGQGQHEAVGRFLQAVLDAPPADRAAKRYDRHRRTRNQSRYAAVPIGASEATLAGQTAKELHAAAIAKGVGT